MRRIRRALRLALSATLAAGLLCAGFLGGLRAAQDPGQDPAVPGPDEAAGMMEMMMMMELAEPGPEHEEIAKGVGTWDFEAQLFMPPMPGIPEGPMTTEGETRNEMVLGGRFLMARSTGSFMGQATESIGFLGYDRRNDKYVTVGLDTMGTYFITAEGIRDEDGIIRLHGHDDDGMGGQDFLFEVDDSDPDRNVTTLFFTRMAGMALDPPHKLMEMVQTRRRDG